MIGTRSFAAPFFAVLLWGATALAAPESRFELSRVSSVQPQYPVATYRLADLDGDGRDELLVVGVVGRVEVFAPARNGGFDNEPKGGLVLPDAGHCLLALAPVLSSRKDLQLLALGPRGTRAYALVRGGFSGEGRLLAAQARFPLRTGWPRFSNILQDLNGDGKSDLVVPGVDQCEIWIAGKDGYRLASKVPVEVSVKSESGDGGGRGEELSQSITIPDLDIRDVNGDGRLDLVVTEGTRTVFRLQRPDGSIPKKPDAVLDLDRFQDTTPKASVRPGYVLAGVEKPKLLIRDIDGDSIPDYVIAHRRKVWVFFGSKKGPQFDYPDTILKTADDITAIFLADLDGDGDSDLLLLRVQVPSLGTILTGLLSSLDVEIRALGYANENGREFSKTPKWSSDHTFTLPPLTKVMRDPDALIGKIENAIKSFRRSMDGDFDGDGKPDLALLSRDQKKLEIWRGRSAKPPTREGIDKVAADVLFHDPAKEWDIDWFLDLVETLGARRAEHLTAGSRPDATLTLRDPARYDLVDLAAAHLEQGKREALVCVYSTTNAPHRYVFDVYEASRR